MLSFFPRDVLGEILDLIESVSEGFLTYSFSVIQNQMILIFIKYSIVFSVLFILFSFNITIRKLFYDNKRYNNGRIRQYVHASEKQIFCHNWFKHFIGLGLACQGHRP